MLKPITLSEDKLVPKTVQLLRVGQFKFENGDEIEITSKLLKSFKVNFDNKVRGYDDGKLPVDYYHENDKIASGWIHQLNLVEGETELWAEVSWTPRAMQMLADGEIRYISAEFHFDYQHNEGGQKYGPTLLGAGLTNRPFIKGMKPVVLAEKNDPVSEKIAKLINEGYPQDQAVAIAKDLERQGKLGEGENYMMTIEQAMAKIAELEAKLKAVEGEKEMLAGDMQKKDTAYAEEKKLAEKANTFNKMLSEGKVIEAARESFMGNDMVKFAEINKTAHTKAVGTSGEGNTVEKDIKKDTQEEIHMLAEAMAKEKGISYGDAVSRVLRDKKELNEKYLSEVPSGFVKTA